MKLVLLLTTLLLMQAMQLASDSAVSTFTIKSMVVEPTPPQRSKKVTTTLVYSSAIAQPVSKVHLVTYLGSTKIDTRDVSNVVSMDADKDYTWVYSDTIPFIAPSGNYKVEYHIMDPAGAELGMIANEFHLN